MHKMNAVYYYVNPTNPYKIEYVNFLDELIVMLYEGNANYISETQVSELKLPENYLSKLRRQISQFEERLPLYDITYNHIFLIHKENIYPRIFHDNYRFVDQYFLDDLLNLKNLNDFDKQNIRILQNYDIKILQKTYMKIFYESFVFNSYITNCRRPSFASRMDHINPYYTIDELYYLAYDWNLINSANLKKDEINGLCKYISSFDIPAKTLLDHQIFIYDAKAIGLVKHYSLFGSYFMNRYLREYQCCSDNPIEKENIIKNTALETQIKLMINLVINAPEFQKDHTVYRFIEDDSFLKRIKVGGTYVDPSFISTTRNPFSYQDNYQFGYILLKIKLPANIKGIGLCIEAYSNFPTEEEIILPPTSELRLDSIIEGPSYQKYQHILKKKVEKKYEFTLIGNSFLKNKEVKLTIPNAIESTIPIVNFWDLLNNLELSQISISERLQFFVKNYVDINYQFKSIIGSTEYLFLMESYNSTNVYKKFFTYETTDGILIYSFHPKYGNINLMLELGINIHVNYYFKYSVTDSSHQLDLNKPEWIQWLSLFAYIIGSRSVIIHSNYSLNYKKTDSDEQKQMKTRYTFSQNVYIYLKERKKLFDSYVGMTPGFYYSELDYINMIPIANYIKSTDKDELYRIYKLSKCDTMGQFYLYIIEFYPKLLSVLEEKMALIFPTRQNPLDNIYYTLDPWIYLYDNKSISFIPLEKEFNVKKGSFKSLIGDKKIPQFKNRLRTYLTRQ